MGLYFRPNIDGGFCRVRFHLFSRPVSFRVSFIGWAVFFSFGRLMLTLELAPYINRMETVSASDVGLLIPVGFLLDYCFVPFPSGARAGRPIRGLYAI
jgi:hypothetical protein